MAYNTDVRSDISPRGEYETIPVTTSDDIRSIMLNRVAWGAVFAGAAMALTAQLIFNLAGIGIGAVTLGPETAGAVGAETAEGLSFGAAIWITVTGIIAAFIGGYTAGHLTGDHRESTAGWHGLTSWAASVLIITVMVMAGAGAFMDNRMNTAGLGTLSMAGVPAGQEQTYPGGTTVSTEMEAQRLAQSEGIPIDEARARVLQTSGGAMVDRETVADMVAQGALISAIGLLLSALAAWFGGKYGAIPPVIANEKTRLH